MDQGQRRKTLAVGKVIRPLVKCSIFRVPRPASFMCPTLWIIFRFYTCHLLQGSESKQNYG